jgi:hypothetical protein
MKILVSINKVNYKSYINTTLIFAWEGVFFGVNIVRASSRNVLTWYYSKRDYTSTLTIEGMLKIGSTCLCVCVGVLIKCSSEGSK